MRAASSNALAHRRDLTPGPLQHVQHTPCMDDYALTRFQSDGRYPEIAEVISLGHPWHYRQQLAPAYGEGWGEFCGWSDGFFVFFGDCTLANVRDVTLNAPDMLLIRVGLQGAGEFIDPSGQAVSYDGPSTLVVIEPAGARPSRSVFQGRTQAVQIYVSRDVLNTIYQDDDGELPPVLQAFLAQGLPETQVRRLLSTPDLMRCVEALQDCEFEGRTRRYFIQSKTVEMLCHVIEALKSADGDDTADCSMIAARGALKAQAILAETYAAPPTLDDLARDVGMSRSGLTAAFRKVFGKSVFAYIQDLRMEQAVVLLNDPAASVTQVAYALGYNHVSSFTVAIQRRFGVAPRALRRRSLPLGPAGAVS